jgi:mannonate dehydratase
MEVMLGQLQELDLGILEFARQLGIEAVQFNTPAIDGAEGYWTYETLMSLGRACQESGLVLQAIENVPGQFMTDIKFGGPAREHQLDNYCRTVENMGRAGIGILGFNFATTGVWRTEREALGRGGARVSAFDAAMLESGNEEVGPQGVVAGSGGVMITEEELWRNFEIFLHRVLPVAEAAGVRLALHPDDPPLPAIGPTARLFYSVENMRRAYETAEGSEAFGFDLCLGTVSEMSDGAEAVRGAIETFGPQGAIVYVHFRQVVGTVPKFQECFLGEGSYSPRATMDLLASSGFDGYLLDDHVPQMLGDTKWGHSSHAYAIGYMHGLLCDLKSSR